MNNTSQVNKFNVVQYKILTLFNKMDHITQIVYWSLNKNVLVVF